MPLEAAAGLCSIIFPPSTIILPPLFSFAFFEIISKFVTSDIEAKASPLKPKVLIESKSSIE